ncbi:MAG: GGDEF domain-containing protein [Ruminococcus sp.]|nr:GGDEF domain-containing protein [Ruminococcus sp.]
MKQPSHIKSIRTKLVIFYSLILTAALVTSFMLMYIRMNESKDRNIGNMATFSSSLLKERIIDFMDNTEKTCEIFYRSEYRDFYPDGTVSDTKRNEIQDNITAELLNISLNDYYADFGIAYSDGSTAGIITDSTRDCFDGDIYSGLSSYIESGKNSGWGTGTGGNYEKLYFVKRINEGAVITVSSYSMELERRLKDVSGLDIATTALIDRNGIVVCGADNEVDGAIGTHIDNEPLALIKGYDNITLQNENFYVSADRVTENWQTICIVSKEDYIKDNRRLISSVVLITSGAVVLSVLICLLLTRQLSASVLTKLYANTLDGVDRLTKLTNKFSTEDMIIDTLESSPMGSCYGLVLIDIDNLKDINDNLGRAVGDDTIIQISSLIRTVFGEEAVIGRLGGDKFETLADVSDYDLFKCLSTLESKCNALCESLRRSYADEEHTHPIAVSVGAALYPLSSDTYEGLLANADEALRQSKQRGGGCYTVYRKADTKKDGDGI